jgi:drug/metabolite transporter (DMT)-like permease
MSVAGRTYALLGLNGLVIAAHTLLARTAGQGGASPLLYAFVSAAGASLFLVAYRALAGSGRRAPIDAKVLRFGAIAGLVSVALPQALIYSASAYVSAGVASLAYAFPTPLTYVLACLFGLERPAFGRAAGIAVAFGGALILAASRSPVAGAGLWIGLAMLAPVFIAAGNIYRARFWPEGSTPLDLALVMNAAAALWLLAGLLAGGEALRTEAITGALGPLAAAPLVAAFGTVIYFELQRAGGIVSFSQIGYVGAILGLVGGMAVLGESYPAPMWIAALVIAAGIAISEAFRPASPR